MGRRGVLVVDKPSQSLMALGQRRWLCFAAARGASPDLGLAKRPIWKHLFAASPLRIRERARDGSPDAGESLRGGAGAR